MPQCSRCGASLPFIDARALWYEGRRICQGCAAKIESPPSTTEQVQPQPQLVTREVIKEREVIREIVKIRCRHCGTAFEERLDRCPHCGAPP